MGGRTALAAIVLLGSALGIHIGTRVGCCSILQGSLLTDLAMVLETVYDDSNFGNRIYILRIRVAAVSRGRTNQRSGRYMSRISRTDIISIVVDA